MSSPLENLSFNLTLGFCLQFSLNYNFLLFMVIINILITLIHGMF